MCSEREIKLLVDEILQRAKKEYGSKLDSVILYGSYARNEADDESDVDIMILVDEDREKLLAQRYNWNCFGTDLDLKYGVLTSMKLQDTKSFYEWREVLPFYRNVLNEGVRLYA